MFDVEVLNSGRQGGVTDLGDGRQQPIWFSISLSTSAWYEYLKTIISPEQDADDHLFDREFHLCFIAFAEFGCTIDKLGQLLGVKVGLVVKVPGFIHESYL
jgi:hypothetical protein